MKLIKSWVNVVGDHFRTSINNKISEILRVDGADIP